MEGLTVNWKFSSKHEKVEERTLRQTWWIECGIKLGNYFKEEQCSLDCRFLKQYFNCIIKQRFAILHMVSEIHTVSIQPFQILFFTGYDNFTDVTTAAVYWSEVILYFMIKILEWRLMMVLVFMRLVWQTYWRSRENVFWYMCGNSEWCTVGALLRIER